jgi:hypothetical protein
MRNTGIRVASVAAAAVLGMSLPTGSAVAAEERCVPGQQVSAAIQALLDELRGEVPPSAGRAVGHALKEAVQTFRGADADTAAERRQLGAEIRALVSRRADTESTVKRKAITVEVKSLQEQRERGRFTAAEKRELRAALQGLRAAVVAEADNPGVGRTLSAELRELLDDVGCER